MLGSGVDYALAFDGVHDYATLGNSNFPWAASDQTISLWFAPASTSGRQSLVALRKDLQSGFELGFEDGALAAWRVFGDRRYFDRASGDSSLALEAGVWHHLAYVYDRGAMQALLYLDGQAFDSASVDPGHRTPTSAWLGTRNGWEHLYQGRIDELRIWSVARTAEQIAGDFAGTLADEANGLVGYWTFDEASGARAYDYSGFSNDAALGDGIAGAMPARVRSDSPVSRP